MEWYSLESWRCLRQLLGGGGSDTLTVWVCFRDSSLHSFISRFKGSWNFAKSYGEGQRDGYPTNTSDIIEDLLCLDAHKSCAGEHALNIGIGGLIPRLAALETPSFLCLRSSLPWNTLYWLSLALCVSRLLLLLLSILIVHTSHSIRLGRMVLFLDFDRRSCIVNSESRRLSYSCFHSISYCLLLLFLSFAFTST